LESDHPLFLPVYRYRDVKKVLGISYKKFQDLKMIFKDSPLFKGKLAKPAGEKHNWVLLSHFDLIILSLIFDLHNWLKIPYARLVDPLSRLNEIAQKDPEVFKKSPLYLITDLNKNIVLSHLRERTFCFDDGYIILELQKYLEPLKIGV